MLTEVPEAGAQKQQGAQQPQGHSNMDILENKKWNNSISYQAWEKEKNVVKNKILAVSQV